MTHPNLSYAMNQLCQHMHSPTVAHWSHMKRVLWYVKGTLHFGLRFRKSASSDLHAFSDCDWDGCLNDQKSTSDFAVFLGSNLVSWVCKKQCTVVCSSTEAEYKALDNASTEVTWIVLLLCQLGITPLPMPKLWCDNLGVTYMSTNLVFHARTKHIEIDYHFVCDKIASDELQVNFISMKD